MPERTEWEDRLSTLDDVRSVSPEQRARIFQRVLDLDRADTDDGVLELPPIRGDGPEEAELRSGSAARVDRPTAGRVRSPRWLAAAAAVVVTLATAGALLLAGGEDDAQTAASLFPSAAAEQACTELRTTVDDTGLLEVDDPTSLDAAAITSLGDAIEAFTLQLRTTADIDGDDLAPWTRVGRQLNQAEVFLRAGDREQASAIVDDQREVFDSMIRTDDHPLVEACFTDLRE